MFTDSCLDFWAELVPLIAVVFSDVGISSSKCICGIAVARFCCLFEKRSELLVSSKSAVVNGIEEELVPSTRYLSNDVPTQ